MLSDQKNTDFLIGKSTFQNKNLQKQTLKMNSVINGIVSFAPIVLTGGAIGMVAAQLLDHSKLGFFFEKDKNLVARTLILFVVGAVAALIVWVFYCLLYSLIKSKMNNRRMRHHYGHDEYHQNQMNDEQLQAHCEQSHPDVDLRKCVKSHRNMYYY